MRIALVARGIYPFDFGGREIRVYHLAKNSSQKHEVTVFVPQGRASYPKKYKNFAIRPISTILRSPRLLNFGGSILFARKVSKVLKEGEFDVVDILFYSFPFEKKSRVIATVMAAYPMWRNVIGYRKVYVMPSAATQAWLNLVKIRFADRIICVSDSSRKEVLSLYGAPLEKATTIKNGVDAALFNPRVKTNIREKFGIGNDVYLVLYAGRLVGEKGVQDLIKAVRVLVSDYNIRLMVVGEGSFKERLRRMARGETLFIDPQPYEIMPKFYRAADLFVLPSYWEVQPLACIEAMATATPVVATNVGGIPEVVEHGKTGILVPPGDLKALRKAILKFYKDPEFRKKIVENGLKFARERTWNKVVEETLRVYEG